MNRTRSLTALGRLTFSLGLSLANLGAQTSAPQKAGKPSRSIAAGEWQAVRTIGLDSDLFVMPVALKATADRLIVADDGDNSIKSFRMTGQLEWRFGRAGSGPGEFRQLQDIAIDSAGNVVAYDSGLERLTVIDPSGRLLRVLPLRQRTDRVAFGGSTARFLLLNTASDTFARIVDTTGAVVRPLVKLPEHLRASLPITREMSGVVTSRTGYLVTLRWTSRMLLVTADGSIARECMGIDSLSLPGGLELNIKAALGELKNIRANRVDPRARQAATASAMLGDYLVVKPSIPRGQQRLLDFYGLNCGPYRESRPLPVAATMIAGSNRLLSAVVMDPVPHIVVLRWIRKQTQ
jgi:hypothetical protein